MRLPGLGQALHDMLEELRGRIPFHHADTLQHAGSVLKGNEPPPDHWTEIPGYEDPPIDPGDRHEGDQAAFEAAAAAEVTADLASDETADPTGTESDGVATTPAASSAGGATEDPTLPASSTSTVVSTGSSSPPSTHSTGTSEQTPGSPV